MPITAIIAGAAVSDYGWLAENIRSADFIICADSGLRHAHAINLTPDVIIGDFDSVDADLLNKYIDKSDITHDRDQNTTDLMKALNKAPQGHEIHIYGAVGERADHDFSNYLILLERDECNHIILKTEHDERRIIKQTVTFSADIGDMVGVFPLLPIETLSYKGLQYPAEGLGKPYEFGWNGSCNPVIAESVEIAINSGAALVTRSFKTI